MRDHAMADIVLEGLGPTWRNGRTDGEGIAKRIDRFLICQSLSILLPNLESSILIENILDHKPIMLAWSWDLDVRSFRFKFNLRWLQMKEFDLLVHSVWQR